MPSPLILPAPDLSLNGRADEVRPLFIVGQEAIDARQRAFGEAGGSLLVVDLFSTHATSIADITYLTSPL